MRTISTVLATAEFNEAQYAEIRAAAGPSARFIFASRKDGAAIDEALQTAEVAILAGDLDERHIKAPKLKWVHCDHAGLNKSARPEVFARGLLVTSSAGRSAPALAEHCFFFMLSHTYHVRDVLDAQARHHWGVPSLLEGRALYGKTLGIFGMGHTGRELAIRGKAFGMRVLAYRRKVADIPQGVDRMYCRDAGDSTDAVFRESDYIALCLSLTDQTYHLIGTREIDMMKPGAVVINMARGDVIDEEALLSAVRSGKLGMAGLDTTAKEPLPADSPLWDAPNVIITPHATPRVPDKSERSIRVICENMRRFQSEEPLVNLLTADEVFTKY